METKSVVCMVCGDRFATIAESLTHPHMSGNRMEITPRVVSDYTYGKCLYYSRTINGTPYRFTFVLMENGERRHFVSKYNGYCADTIALGFSSLETVLGFACAWSQVHFITVKP